MGGENKEEVEVSIIFPAYNEAGRIEWAVEKASEALEKITQSYEIIIAEDGSTDGTNIIASRLSREHPSVKHLHNDTRLGRGKALTKAFKSSEGEILIYMDVDLSTDIKYLRNLVESIREGYDFATGSRMLPESRVERTISRKIASKCYNFMVRTLLGTKIRDHQCGFKSFKRKSLLRVLDEVTANHWFWDTETVIRGSQRGWRIKEIPVEWRHKGETKVNLLKDIFTMGTQVLKLWWKQKSSKLYRLGKR